MGALTSDSVFSPFDVRWDEPQLGPAELALRTSFEWWYFDLQTGDGVSMVVVFSRKNPVLSTHRSSLYIEYRDARGHFNEVRNYDRTSSPWRESGDARMLRVGPNTLRIRGNEPAELSYELRVDLPQLQATLEMRPLHRGFLPGEDGSYFRARSDARRRTSVSFSAPLTRVHGTVRFRGTERTVNGRGYHDHPWGTVQLFDTHRAWHWARLSSESLGAMFATVTPAEGFDGALDFLYLGESAAFEPRITQDLQLNASVWKRDHFYGIRFPHELTARSRQDAITLQATGSLLDTPIYNRSQVQWQKQAGEAGQGWIEYYSLPRLLRLPVFLGGRLASFFWRPFPFFGR